MEGGKPRLRFSGKARELLCLNSYISILDNEKVIVENCKQILECNEVMARVITGSFEVEILGQRLMMNNYDSHSVEVIGLCSDILIMKLTAAERRR